MKEFLIHFVGAMLSTNAIHSYVFVGSLFGIWWGVSEFSRPAATVVVSVVMLGLVIYARTRKVGQ